MLPNDQKLMAPNLSVGRGLVDEGLHTTEGRMKDAEVFSILISSGEVGPVCTSYTLQVSDNEHLLHPIIKLLNHSCNPSIRLDIVDGSVVGYAVRDLEPGAELTFDYMTIDLEQAQGGMECKCGALKCNGILNGFNNLTKEQAADRVHLFGGAVKKAYQQSVIVDQCHTMIGTGENVICSVFIPSGNCSCCTFKKGNWIGLLPGEDNYLEKEGTIEGWTGREEGGITCTRNPEGCNNKPLDCKLYPFFPYSVNRVEDGYLINLGAGDQKCSAKSVLVDALKGVIIEKGTTLPFGELLYTAGLVGAYLSKNGMCEWMHNTYAGYVDYSPGYRVLVTDKDLDNAQNK